MKILIAYAHPSELAAFFKAVDRQENETNCTYKHISIDFVQTGYTVYETAFAMGKALASNRYHLILYAGLAYSLNDMMKTGEVLNVINDIPFSIGHKSEDGFQHAYFNVFLPFMKTAALTSPQLEGDQNLLEIKTDKFQMHIESTNGLGFHYACLHEGMPFYQLRAIERNVILNNENKELALENLNKALKQIVDLL